MESINDVTEGGFGMGLALGFLKSGHKVYRKGWNGKDMWLELIKTKGTMHREFQVLPYIVMKTADNKIVPWLASQTDLLADDWAVYVPHKTE
jgi:hypothetical protein